MVENDKSLEPTDLQVARNVEIHVVAPGLTMAVLSKVTSI